LINETLIAKQMEEREKELFELNERKRNKIKEQPVTVNITNKIENQDMTKRTKRSTEPVATYSYTIAVVLIGALLFIPLSSLPIVKGILFSAVLIILIALVGTFQLRNDDQLSQKNFMEIFILILKKVPPLTWFSKKEK
jgi:hypothetical protein